MNDPQIWTLIAMMSAVFGMAGMLSRSLRQEMRAGFEAVGARFDAMDAKLTSEVGRLDIRLTSEVGRVDAKIDERFDRLTDVMNARFTDVDHRLTTVEGDLSLVKGHLIGQRSA